MVSLITDVQWNSLAIVVVAIITTVGTTMAAFWARSANATSKKTQKEVSTNGGMDTDDPDGPNINDHIKYQTDLLEGLVGRVDNQETLLANHIAHSKVMDAALAEVYLVVKPSERLRELFKEERDSKHP